MGENSKTLIVCIDRDNDLGEKAKVETPIIGRESNLKAATALGLADPEDSDMNTVFGGLQLYDRFKSEGKEVEIASICGDIDVGITSDQRLKKEITEVLEKVKPDNAILVTDGAEDEVITPLLASRVEIDHVKRIYVKQSANIESNIHVILRTMREQKIRRKVFIPTAAALMVWGFFAWFGYWVQGIAAIMMIVGVYLLIQALNLEPEAVDLFHDLESAIVTTRISMYFAGIAGVLVIAGIVNALSQVQVEWPPSIPNILELLGIIIWWLMAAALIYAIGRNIDRYVKTNKFDWYIVPVVFSIPALAFILTGTFYIIDIIFLITEEGISPAIFAGFQQVLFYLGIGIVLAIMGYYVRKRIAETIIDEQESEPIASTD